MSWRTAIITLMLQVSLMVGGYELIRRDGEEAIKFCLIGLIMLATYGCWIKLENQ